MKEIFYIKSHEELRRRFARSSEIKTLQRDYNVSAGQQSLPRLFPSVQDEQEFLKQFLSEGDKSRRIRRLFIQQYESIIDHIINESFQHVPMSEHDNLRQVGRMTLVIIARIFDPERGVRFTTLVAHRMWQEMSKYAIRKKIVTVGREDTEELEQIHALKRKTARQELEDEKLRKILGISKVRFDDLMMLDQSLATVSMERLLKRRNDKGSDQPLWSQEHDARWTDFEEQIELETAIQDIFAHMNLSDRNRRILVMYFGIHDEQYNPTGSDHTQATIAEEVNLSAVSVSRIISELLDKIERYCRQFDTEENIEALRRMQKGKETEQQKSMEALSITFHNNIPIPTKYAVSIDSLGLFKELVYKLKNPVYSYWDVSTQKYIKGPINTLYELIEVLRSSRGGELLTLSPRERNSIIVALKSVGITLSKYNKLTGLDLNSSFLAIFRDELLEAQRIAQK